MNRSKKYEVLNRMTAAALLKEIQTIIPVRSDALDILAFIMGAEYEKLSSLMSVNIEQDERAAGILNRLREGCPPAYITNRRHFYGREFFVNENVLIPRYETEILVEKAIELTPCENPRILDLCTGSGCILLSLLAEIKGASGVGVDISPGALEVAKENSRRLGLADRAEFVQGDVLGNLNVRGRFDMVLCNPPYVTEQEYESLEKSVMYEPVQALVAADEGLLFYKKLIDIVPDLCNKNWVALAEIGAGQSKALSGIYSGFSADYEHKSPEQGDLSAGSGHKPPKTYGDFEHRFYCDLSGIKRVLFWKSWS
ncbi:MAG: peptide chain release factor N(5)-glutamine methyltransferase [Geovibrio sp.]|jgi:release factor glutamine methyltransferase|nr:peptide chain release factor N(5)-glutamine methyltransferase [Geovibrio sp.]